MGHQLVTMCEACIVLVWYMYPVSTSYSQCTWQLIWTLNDDQFVEYCDVPSLIIIHQHILCTFSYELVKVAIEHAYKL